MNKKIYLIWIWWIWISAIARYYLEKWYEVFWSDKTHSELIQKMIGEWMNIIIGEDDNRITKDFELIVYTEAVPKSQSELNKALKMSIKILTYPQALANITNDKKLITIAWTHWKSTTTSLTSLILKNSDLNFTSIVWTLLKEFDWKNFYHRHNNIIDTGEYFIIEACEYKRSFLAYKPFIAVITNIELDHLDYYKNLDDYINAYKNYIDNIRQWWFVIINWQDKNCQQLTWLRKDLQYIEVYNSHYRFNWQDRQYPKIDINIPWEHILFDAKISYVIWQILNIDNNNILNTLKEYKWVWRRMEKIWNTINNNLLMSDYWHHPTEIKLTLNAIKNNNMDKKILTIFQPHQYNRTLELLDWFIYSFKDTDFLIIPNIYESRDSKEDMSKINSKKLIWLINHPNKFDGQWFDNTLKMIEDYDWQYPWELIIILLGAWNVDDLRYKIKMK